MAIKQYGGASIITLALLLGAFASVPIAVQSVGVNNGLMGNNLPSASQFVAQCSQVGISNIRIYKPEPRILNALSGTNIGLILGAPTDDLPSLAGSYNTAHSWVLSNVAAYPDVNFQYIAVGNDVAPGNGIENVVKAMKNIAEALSTEGLSNIRVSTAINYEGTISQKHHPPSIATFSPHAMSHMTDLGQYLQNTGAPLLVNIYPYNEYAATDSAYGVFSLEYALFTAKGDETKVDPNSNLPYQNLFDALVDAMYYALEAAGAPNVPIVVSESGWPTYGGKDTTPRNAQIYNQNLINHVGNGTPKNPTRLDLYIFAMYDENQKTGGGVERHWGMFNANQSPKYNINFD